MVKTKKHLNFNRKYYTNKKFKNLKKKPQVLNKISKKIKNRRKLVRKNTRRKNLSTTRLKKAITLKNNLKKKSIYALQVGSGTPQNIIDERNFLFGISNDKTKKKTPTKKDYAVQLKEYYNDILHNDMLEWKKKKSMTPNYLSEDKSATLVPEPENDVEPENNFLLYLKENYDYENIVGGKDVPSSGTLRDKAERKKEIDNWFAADKVGLEKEAKSILGSTTLDSDDINNNFWIDQRMLGKFWKGLFDDIKSSDDEIPIGDLPTPPM